MQNRAYAVLEAKALDQSKRTFSGIATTPAPDRVSDTISPTGVRFSNPLVLLHQHDHDRPIGRVKFKEASGNGIEFEAEIPVVTEPGPLKDRVDTAWGEIQHGIVRAVSIGFRPIKYAHRDDGGIDYQEIEVFELSTVSVPANSEAIISAIKSLDGAARKDAGIEPISEPAPAATGKEVRVVKLHSASDLAKPFQINRIIRS